MDRQNSMAHHIFLTGEKQVGKSTLLKRVLSGHKGLVGGFLTVRTDMFLKDGWSVHMFGFHDEKTPDENNLLFVCGREDEKRKERFNRLGCEILSRDEKCPLLIMDELGPKEADAALFRRAVLRSVDRCPHILGVLQAPCESFWPEIVKNPTVEIIEITKENREDERLAEYISMVTDC